MKRRQFEEILDECISAYLSGRRSVEDSLSLYPSIARELQPLLRAAADTADTLQELRPPPRVQERIRLNILRAASERAAARALTRHIDGFTTRADGRGHWFLAIPALAAATAAIVVLGLVVLPGGSSDPSTGTARVSVVERPEFSTHLTAARRQLDAIRTKTTNGEAVTQADIEALLGTTRGFAQSAEPSELAARDQVRLEQILEEQLALLGELSSKTYEEREEIEDAVAVTVSVAAVFGVAVTAPDLGDEPRATSDASPAATSNTGSDPAASASPFPTSSPSAGATSPGRD